jgi:hypothetical protein
MPAAMVIAEFGCRQRKIANSMRAPPAEGAAANVVLMNSNILHPAWQAIKSASGRARLTSLRCDHFIRMEQEKS